MPAARDRYIAELLSRHIEDLAFLWGQRREALVSCRHTLRDLAAINERIEGHLSGIFVAPHVVRQDLLAPMLASSDRDEVCAGAYALLYSPNSDSSHAVTSAFAGACGSTLEGLRDALSVINQLGCESAMKSALKGATPRNAASAAVVLANHHRLDGTSPELGELLVHADPQVSALAWRAVTHADAAALGLRSTRLRPFEKALQSESPSVRTSAWAAAAWAAEPWVLTSLREFVATGDAVAVHWLAVLGNDEDAPLLQRAALATEDVDRRCGLLARFGHPTALNALVRWMEGDDLPLAVAAGEAFKRITGMEVKGERTTLPVADDADEFTREMAPLVWLPDVAKAHSLMLLHGPTWFEGSRWCEGRRLDIGVDRETLPMLDMDARWDAAARAALAGQPVSAPCPIH